jgi:hypothetical protein
MPSADRRNPLFDGAMPAGVAAPRRAHQRRNGCCDKWLVEFEREAMAAGILQLPSRRGALPHLRSAHREELLMTEPAKSIVQADFNGVYLLID